MSLSRNRAVGQTLSLMKKRCLCYASMGFCWLSMKIKSCHFAQRSRVTVFCLGLSCTPQRWWFCFWKWTTSDKKEKCCASSHLAEGGNEGVSFPKNPSFPFCKLVNICFSSSLVIHNVTILDIGFSNRVTFKGNLPCIFSSFIWRWQKS